MPLNISDSSVWLAVKASDFEQALNQQTLKVSGLGAPKYALEIHGEKVAELTKDELASGVNLAELRHPNVRARRRPCTLGRFATMSCTLNDGTTCKSLTNALGTPTWRRHSRVWTPSKATWLPSSDRKRSRPRTALNLSRVRDLGATCEGGPIMNEHFVAKRVGLLVGLGAAVGLGVALAGIERGRAATSQTSEGDPVAAQRRSLVNVLEARLRSTESSLKMARQLLAELEGDRQP